MHDTLERAARTARRHPRLAIALLRRLADEARSRALSAVALDALYERYFVLERLGEARGILEELYAGLQAAESAGLARQAGRMLEAIGRVHYTHGEYEDAVHCWGQCVHMFEVTGDVRSGVEARIGLGAIYNAIGDWRTSARFHQDARSLLGEADDPYLRTKLALNLGVNLRLMGQRAEAARQFEVALREAQRGDIREYIAEAYWHLGQCVDDDGDVDRAQTLIRSALTLAHGCGYTWLGAAALITLARMLQRQGKHEDAGVAYEEGLEIAQQVESRPQQVICHSALSALAEARGDLAAALSHARQHMALELEIKNTLNAPDQLRNMQQHDLSEKPPIQKLLELSSSDAMHTPDLQTALATVAQAAAGILRLELIVVWLREPDSGRMVCRALAAPGDIGLATGVPLPQDRLPVYAAIQRDQHDALVVHDLRIHPAGAELRSLFAPVELQSLLEAPLQLRGEKIGVVAFGQVGKRRNWTRDDVLFGSHIAHLIEHILSDRQHLDIQAQLASANQALEQRVQARTAELQDALRALEESSLTDPLTGLRNRRFLLQHLDNDAALSARHCEAGAAGGVSSVPGADLILFMVDLDHFKAVNDTHGHLAGDAVLMQIKERLCKVFRESDYLVRWGGEEFLIVARATMREMAPLMAERVRVTVAGEAFRLPDGTRLIKTCSVGFAAYPFIRSAPRAVSWQEVVGIVDTALYAAKRAGRNGWVGIGAAPMASAEGLLPALKASPQDAVRRGQALLATNLDEEQVLAAFSKTS
jgi:diguanylate cyclase (GGDEF)-like protein